VKVFHESSNEFREYRLGKTTFQEQYVTMFSYLSCKVIVYPQTLMFRKNIINASAFVYSFRDVFIQTELLQHGQKKNPKLSDQVVVITDEKNINLLF
jgi:hypothetical protein